MKKILFVCHGNICRSPMAEFCMKKLLADAGLSGQFEVASAATSTEEIGNSVYPPARRLLNAKGIDCSGKFARQITQADYLAYDLIVGMDNANIRNMKRFWNGDAQEKIHRLLDFTDRPGEVADPWYSGDFETTWKDVFEGCSRLLELCQSNTI